MNDESRFMPATAQGRGSLMPSRRDMILGAAMAATAAFTYEHVPRTDLRSIGPHELDKIVPLDIGPWHYEAASGVVLPPPDQLARLLYDQQVARFYSADVLLPVMLVMAYGSSQGGILQVHRPEICYPASGFRLSDTMTRELDIGGGQIVPARFFTARSDTRVEQVLYWTRIGNYLPTSWTSQRIAIMRNNLDGLVPDGLLVRISTITDDSEAGLNILQQFARQMLASAGLSGRHKLLGNHYH